MKNTKITHPLFKTADVSKLFHHRFSELSYHSKAIIASKLEVN